MAEARDPGELGQRMQRGLTLSGAADAVGLYLLGDREPRLCYSDGAPTGFLDEYASDHAGGDPLLDSLSPSRPVVDGLGVFGSRAWTAAPLHDLLRRWDYRTHLCGGVWEGRELRAVFYSAWTDVPRHEARVTVMATLCRAASLALRSGATEAMSRPPRLSPRAAAVAAELRRGATNKEIAIALAISCETVKDHVAAICRRMGARNRTDLVARLAQDGRGPEGDCLPREESSKGSRLAARG